ncbi:tetratricopeptide repeat protein [Sphingomonas sp. R647]|uniref:tetratricopeptide repeat protein n=1 Tax=Sphingomonas sp. R647 TaxID=2875233 RepID=UPI001CD24854|nr:tetratricopeptide repeat protein [Sphingomonas sp. R647]MCA1197218.1 tetratricopeptide repeat protein [Sphingomonas sp. R647]
MRASSTWERGLLRRSSGRASRTAFATLAVLTVTSVHAQDSARVQPVVPETVIAAGDFALGHRLVGQQLTACLQTAARQSDCLDLLHAMGNLSIRVDRADEAEAHARRALAIGVAASGPRSIDAARAQRALAEALSAQSRFQAAYDAARAAAGLYRSILGPDDPAVVDARAGEAEAAWELGLIDAASLSYKEAVGAAQRNMQRATPAQWAAQQQDFARLYNDYATFLREIGYPQAGENFAREATRIWRDTLGPEHPGTGVGFSTYGLILNDLRRFDEAVVYLRESLRIRLASRQSVTAILTGYNNLAVALDDGGDRAGAGAVLRAASELMASQSHGDHLLAATIRANFARYLLSEGRGRAALVEAASQLEAARAIRLRLRPPGHPEIASASGQLASAYARLGRISEAENLYREAVAGSRGVLGATHAQSIRARINFAHFHLDRGRADAALTLYRDSRRDIFARLASPDYTASYRDEIGLYRDAFAGQVEAAWQLAQR